MGTQGLKDMLDIDEIVSQVVAKLTPHLEGSTLSKSGRTTHGSPERARRVEGVEGLSLTTVSVPPITTGDGVFVSTEEAVKAAINAQAELATRSMDDREKIVSAIKRLCEERADEFARLEFEETKIGRLDHKVEKLKLVRRVLGTEALKTDARVDSTGVDLVGAAPWGVIGMVTPATHSVPTMAGNAINVIAAGNSAVFSPHPAASRCFAHALKVFNREIAQATGIRNLLCMVQDPTIASAEELFNHKGVSLICVTGGPFVVKAAMKSGKRVIAAGPGNPPVVVDATADMDKAARDIIAGASFDNNLLCIGEKEVFVVKEAYEAFRTAMKKAGAVELNAAEIAKLTEAALTVDTKHSNHIFAKREFVGADTKVLAAAAGKTIPAGTDLLFGETDEKHPFVVAEQMMPFIPVVRANNTDEAIEMAVRAEHGFRHTAIIHSNDLKVVTKMARRMNTTLFIQNATCAASLGLGGPGYLSYSIATPTGEGVTTPLTFTRQRQMIMGETLNYL